MEITNYILPLGMILPGYLMINVLKVKTQDVLEKLFLSYILSLATILGVLYMGALFKTFNTASLLCIIILWVAIIYGGILFLRTFLSKIESCKYLLNCSEKIILAIFTVALLSIYALFLSSRAILDSDVVHYYLPIAREIVLENEFTYNTGYDYNIFLKPIGISVLSAWTYVADGSITSEPFRLMPLIPLLMLILLNYKVSLLATRSELIAFVSSLIFILMPFHDRFLLYNAFYPDLFYYPLIFASIYYLIKYFETESNYCMFWIGLCLGVASLFKAQTIYFLVAFSLLCISRKLGTRMVSKLLLVFTPFYIIIPIILSYGIEASNFKLIIPSFTQMQIILFAYLFALNLFGIVIYAKLHRNKNDGNNLWLIIKQASIMYLPIIVFAVLWYIPNYFKFGSLIWTSNIGLPNYDWALEILSKSITTYEMPGVPQYLAYFATTWIDPAVMGYVMLIPFLIGLLHMFRNLDRYENLGILSIFVIITASIILSNAVISLSPSNPVAGYNPRDILPLSLFLASVSAIGFIRLIGGQDKNIGSIKLALTCLLVIYFGLLSYVHSVMVWFTQIYNHSSIIGQFTSNLSNMVGLNLQQTSFQISYEYRPIFIGENLHKIFLLSLITALPLLVVAIYRFHPFFTKGYLIKVKIHTSLLVKKIIIVIAKSLIAFLLLFVILFPRIEVLMMYRWPYQTMELQLRMSYGGFYDMFSRMRNLDGGILTFKTPMGLPYYFPGIKIVDLAYPANLAYLRDTLTAESLVEVVERLKQQNIRYLLINPYTITELDSCLNNVISNISKNPDLSTVLQESGGWILFELKTQ